MTTRAFLGLVLVALPFAAAPAAATCQMLTVGSFPT